MGPYECNKILHALTMSDCSLWHNDQFLQEPERPSDQQYGFGKQLAITILAEKPKQSGDTDLVKIDQPGLSRQFLSVLLICCCLKITCLQPHSSVSNKTSHSSLFSRLKTNPKNPFFALCVPLQVYQIILVTGWRSNPHCHRQLLYCWFVQNPIFLRMTQTHNEGKTQRLYKTFSL